MLLTKRCAVMKTSAWKRTKMWSNVVLCLSILVGYPCSSCRRQPAGPLASQAARSSPPDLRGCTHLEVQYKPSTLQALFALSRDHAILSTEESKYLESLKKIVVSDHERIKVLAQKLSLAEYLDGRIPLCRDTADVVGYRDTEEPVTFTVREASILTGDGRCFDCSKTGLDIAQFTPEVWPYVLRSRCCECLEILGSWIHQLGRKHDEYPAPSEWADAIIRRIGSGSAVTELFRCPGAGEGRCHYAMNPNCRRDSPADTVLLFETEAGWNQHGGPELFTFDNHDPKGGLVLLNDGTVKFIRTEEELKQLRWE
jgi:hypothetical protein